MCSQLQNAHQSNTVDGSTAKMAVSAGITIVGICNNLFKTHQEKLDVPNSLH